MSVAAPTQRQRVYHACTHRRAQDAEARGELKPGDTVVEATSGNTGIAVAMVCAQRGYGCVITMAEPFSGARSDILSPRPATPYAGVLYGRVTVVSGRIYSLTHSSPRPVVWVA